jgi:hypothetical protein
MDLSGSYFNVSPMMEKEIENITIYFEQQIKKEKSY